MKLNNIRTENIYLNEDLVTSLRAQTYLQTRFQNLKQTQNKIRKLSPDIERKFRILWTNAKLSAFSLPFPSFLWNSWQLRENSVDSVLTLHTNARKT